MPFIHSFYPLRSSLAKSCRHCLGSTNQLQLFSQALRLSSIPPFNLVPVLITCVLVYLCLLSLPLVCWCQCQIYHPEQPFTLRVISHQNHHQRPDSMGEFISLLLLLLKTDVLQPSSYSLGPGTFDKTYYLRSLLST